MVICCTALRRDGRDEADALLETTHAASDKPRILETSSTHAMTGSTFLLHDV